mmetsp:Transcript_72744/g.165068  ORF Transcript_72744/g.165068 Transcript_72744/m.165068 type:complete len:308 (+) Transcript_72744:33-956(+)
MLDRRVQYQEKSQVRRATGKGCRMPNPGFPWLRTVTSFSSVFSGFCSLCSRLGSLFLPLAGLLDELLFPHLRSLSVLVCDLLLFYSEKLRCADESLYLERVAEPVCQGVARKLQRLQLARIHAKSSQLGQLGIVRCELVLAKVEHLARGGPRDVLQASELVLRQLQVRERRRVKTLQRGELVANEDKLPETLQFAKAHQRGQLVLLQRQFLQDRMGAEALQRLDLVCRKVSKSQTLKRSEGRQCLQLVRGHAQPLTPGERGLLQTVQGGDLVVVQMQRQEVCQLRHRGDVADLVVGKDYMLQLVVVV